MPTQTPSVALPAHLVREIQDALLVSLADLERLQSLLNHAAGNLLDRFGATHQALGHLADKGSIDAAGIRHGVHLAIVELQFHDMATQQLTHTCDVLQGCARHLADEAVELHVSEVPQKPLFVAGRLSPVTERVMDAGTVELF